MKIDYVARGIVDGESGDERGHYEKLQSDAEREAQGQFPSPATTEGETEGGEFAAVGDAEEKPAEKKKCDDQGQGVPEKLITGWQIPGVREDHASDFDVEEKYGDNEEDDFVDWAHVGIVAEEDALDPT